jgi:1-phosphofructokinase
MVAGFLYGFLEKGEYEYAFKMGLSTGSASAFSEYLATKEEVEAVYRSLGH